MGALRGGATSQLHDACPHQPPQRKLQIHSQVRVNWGKGPLILSEVWYFTV